MRRLPLILGSLAAVVTFLLVGPIATAVMLLRSSSDSHGPTLTAQIFIVIVVVALAALSGFAAYVVTRLVLRYLRGRH